LFEGLETAVDGSTGGVEAVLEFRESVGVDGGGLSEGVLLGAGPALLLLIFPGLGFGGAETAEGPLAGDEIVDQEAGFRGGGLVVPVILFDELFEIGEFLGGEDEGLGVDAGFEGVHGRDGFACYRGGAAGFLGVTTIRFDLTQCRHIGYSWWTGREACPTLTIAERFR
jgi:hypothetical protein